MIFLNDFAVFRCKMPLESPYYLNFNELNVFHGVDHRKLYKQIEMDGIVIFI